jgi:glycosyltransferase involved in cell wall biosynthesis
MLPTQPLVTIGIPTRNRAYLLEQTIKSVLNQTYKNIEIIVSDNCSDDNTEEIVRKFGRDKNIYYYRQNTNIGMVNNWNFCLDKANGEFFLLLSDDDILEEDAIRVLQSKFVEIPSASLVYCRFVRINQYGKKINISNLSPPLETGDEFIVHMLNGCRQVLPSTALSRRKVLKLIGGYPDIGNAADLAIFLSLAKYGMVAFVNEPLVKYRVHTGGLSQSLKRVTFTLEALWDWINTNDALYKYKDKVQQYCIKRLKRMVFHEALRGYKDDFCVTLNFLSKIDNNFKYPVVLRCILIITSIFNYLGLIPKIERLLRRYELIFSRVKRFIEVQIDDTSQTGRKRKLRFW